MKIVFASHTSRTGVFRIGSHHYSKEMATVGHEVAHISTPLSLFHAARLNRLQTRKQLGLTLSRQPREIDGVRQVVPLTAYPVTRATPAAARSLLRFSLYSGWKDALAQPDLLIVDQPALASLVDILNPRRTIYRPTDTHSDGRLHAFEASALERVDGIIATSTHVLSSLGSRVAEIPNLVLENGVDFDHFATDTPTHQLPRKGAVYVGALDDRFDWDAVNTMAVEVAMMPSTRSSADASKACNRPSLCAQCWRRPACGRNC